MGHKLRCMGSITEPGLSPDPLQASHRHLSPAAPLGWDFFFQNREELQLGIAAQQEDGRLCTELFANDDEGRNSFPLCAH